MNNLIVSEKIIDQQLNLKEIEEIEFSNGQKTLLVPARCVPCPDEAAASLTLNGNWSVHKWPFADDEKNMAASDYDDRAWDSVSQPGPVFFYDPDADPRTIKDWDRVTLAHIHDDDGAMIRRKVELPPFWQGRRVFLQFNAIYPAGRVYINGHYLGEHASGLTPVQWDVTDQVTPGAEAVITVRLLRKHRYAQMDMVRHALEFTGINQDAFLFATPQVYITDYQLINETADNQSGRIHGMVAVLNHDAALTPELSVDLIAADGTIAAEAAAKETVEPNEQKEMSIDLSLDKPALWNDEFPNLYTVLIRLKIEGRVIETLRYQTGFRRFELKDSRPYLNGNFVKFRGVNHLTFHPELGMFTPKPWLHRSLSLMKKANINCIRTHFLSPPGLAECCDELGIYLMQELPIDWGTHYIHDPEWVGPALMRLEGGVRRDRHHPAIMVWSVGNENMPQDKAVADQGWNHLRLYDRFVKRLDPSRPTMFPPPGPANKIKGIFETRVGDIADTHYSFNLVREINETGKVTNPRSWDADMETHSREDAMKRGWSGVWFSSEYGIFNYQPDLLNSPYLSIICDTPADILSGANTLQVFTDRLRHEWGYMRQDPTCLGGAYFPWLCAGAGKNNPWSYVRWGEDADWGIVTADLLPKPAFWAMRVLFSPVYFPQRLRWMKGETELKFEVENQFNSIDLKDCTLRTQMGGGGRYMGQQRVYQDVPMICPPGQKGEIRIPMWNEATVKALEEHNPVVCRLHLLDPKGFKVLVHDILVLPEMVKTSEGELPVGPDAVI